MGSAQEVLVRHAHVPVVLLLSGCLGAEPDPDGWRPPTSAPSEEASSPCGAGEGRSRSLVSGLCGRTMVEDGLGMLRVDGDVLSVRVSHDDEVDVSDYADDVALQYPSLTLGLVDEYLREHGGTPPPCDKRIERVDVFLVGLELLGDRRRFGDRYQPAAGRPDDQLAGYFEPDGGHAAVIVIGAREGARTTAVHEFAHLLWTSRCLSSVLPELNTEGFAQLIEARLADKDAESAEAAAGGQPEQGDDATLPDVREFGLSPAALRREARQLMRDARHEAHDVRRSARGRRP